MSKKIITGQDMDAASVLINLHKDNEILKCLKDDKDTADAEHTAIKKMKEEVDILKQIKEHTTNYNTLKMFINMYTKEMDNLEITITELLSKQNKIINSLTILDRHNLFF